MLTVREAMGIGIMQRARVIAGDRGLDNVIRSVTVMDTPDIKNWLRGGEFLLSNVYVVRDSRPEQVALVKDLAEKGAAALGIKLKRFVEAVPEEMAELANSLGLPLIEMPVDCAWIDVMEPLYTEILNRQLAVLTRSQQIHATFTRAAIDGGGLRAILKSLAELIHCPTVLTGWEGEVLAQWPEGVGDESKSGQNQAGPEPGPTGEQLVYPVRAGKQVYAHLGVRKGGSLCDRSLSDLDKVAIEHAATVLALEMAKLRAVAEVERRFLNEFLWDVFNGNILSEATLRARARHLGLHLASPQVVMVVDIDGFEDYCARELGGNEEKARQVRERFVEATRQASMRYAPGSASMDLSDSVTVVAPAAGMDARREALRLGEALRKQALAVVSDVNISVGVSRVCVEPMMLSRAYREAREAVTLGREIKGPGSVTHFDELGSYRVLLGGG
ncbi:MAG TPA: hypothetical protein GX513_13455, partial [Firmicutes bacterium]|nr:hypothetical protein [Bacillota bacterium]